MADKKRVQRKVEVTCGRCNITRMWNQKMYDKHMLNKHKIRNEVSIGEDPRTPEQKQLFTL